LTDVLLGTGRNIKGADFAILVKSNKPVSQIHRDSIGDSEFWNNLINQLWSFVPDG